MVYSTDRDLYWIADAVFIKVRVKRCDKIALCKLAYLCDMRLLHAVAGYLKSSNFLATIACRNKPVYIVRFWRTSHVPWSHVFVASCKRALNIRRENENKTLDLQKFSALVCLKLTFYHPPLKCPCPCSEGMCRGCFRHHSLDSSAIK